MGYPDLVKDDVLKAVLVLGRAGLLDSLLGFNYASP